jgi:hypothetical protein
VLISGKKKTRGFINRNFLYEKDYSFILFERHVVGMQCGGGYEKK